ncbi:MAG: DegT/DnrJ/EryC1/StrS family aminotransferase [Clostridiales bacterium]|nr:DegT/DnrJ/EryC1/StrS family aminotransferase [Clostridiales bacterium]
MKSKLAINGGTPFIKDGLKNRYNIGIEEKNAVNKLFDEAIESGQAFGYNGEKEEQFCNDFVKLMGGGYADGVNSGTNAVYVALRALELEPFSEVIVSPITDPGGIMPIVLNNCIPVIIDSAIGTYNMDPLKIEEKITDKTKAIIVAHITGEPCDMHAIMEIAKKHDLLVLEDCAQAHLCELNGQLVGTFGHVASFSTMFGKHFNTGGQGGVVYSTNEDVYWKLRQYADRGKPFGLEDGSTNVVASLNFNMDELSATIGIEQLKKLPKLVEKRRQLVKYMATQLHKLKTISIPTLIDGSNPSYWFLRLEIDNSKISVSKNEFLEAVIAEGVQLLADYSFAQPHLMDWYINKKAYGTKGFPWTAPQYGKSDASDIICENVAKTCATCFNLHLYESWTEIEINQIIDAFKKVEDEYCQ